MSFNSVVSGESAGRGCRTSIKKKENLTSHESDDGTDGNNKKNSEYETNATAASGVRSGTHRPCRWCETQSLMKVPRRRTRIVQWPYCIIFIHLDGETVVDRDASHLQPYR